MKNVSSFTAARFLKLLVLTGLVFLAGSLASAAGTVQAWLMVNLRSQESSLVTQPAEKAGLEHTGWTVSGTGLLATAGADNAIALHRLMHVTPLGNDRMFVDNPAEIESCVKSGYTDQGSLGYVAFEPADGQVAVYRYSKAGNHLFLISEHDRAWAGKNGWNLEGIGFWLWPVAAN